MCICIFSLNTHIYTRKCVCVCVCVFWLQFTICLIKDHKHRIFFKNSFFINFSLEKSKCWTLSC